MEQITLQLYEEEPSLSIPKDLQPELINLIAQTIIEVVKSREGKDDDNV